MGLVGAECLVEQKDPALLGRVATPNAVLFVAAERGGKATPLDTARTADLFGSGLSSALGSTGLRDRRRKEDLLMRASAGCLRPECVTQWALWLRRCNR